MLRIYYLLAKLKYLFAEVSDAAVEFELIMLQSIRLDKSYTIIRYSNRNLELVSELKCA